MRGVSPPLLAAMRKEIVREVCARVRVTLDGCGGEPHRVLGVTRSPEWEKLAGKNAPGLADLVNRAIDRLEKELVS